RAHLVGHRRPQLDLVGRHVEEGDVALGEVIGQYRDGRVAQLPLEVADAVEITRAGDLLEEDARGGQAERVDAEGAQADRAELAVPDRDRVRGAPLLVQALARGGRGDV